MILEPPKRTYGLSPSVVSVVILLTIVFAAVNVFLVSRTDYGASFYANWLAGRVLFAQGQNPYSAGIFENIVLRHTHDVRVSGFTLPLYATLPTLPLSFIGNYDAALVIWMTVCEAALVLIAIRTIAALRLRSGWLSPAVVGSFVLFTYYGAFAAMDGDIGILSVLALLVAVNAVRENELEFAGIMLAFATMKYSLTLLPILWILIWTLANRRGAVAAWFMMVLGLLILISFLFMPNWPTEFLRAIIYYYKYLNPMYFALFIEVWQPEIGGRIAWAVSGVIALLMILEWALNAKQDERAFEWVLAMTLSAGFLVGIPNIGKNLYLLWIPFLYAMDKAMQRWQRFGTAISLALSAAFLLIPWLVSLFYTGFAEPVSALNLIFPFIALILLYWNRWWTIQRIIEPY